MPHNSCKWLFPTSNLDLFLSLFIVVLILPWNTYLVQHPWAACGIIREQNYSTNIKCKFHCVVFSNQSLTSPHALLAGSLMSLFWDTSHPLIIQTSWECSSKMEIPRSITQSLRTQFLWGNIRAGSPRFSSQCFAYLNLVTLVTTSAQRGEGGTRTCQYRVLGPLSSPWIHAQRSGLGLLNPKNTKKLIRQYFPQT